jgi:hypothetical protein
VLEIIQIKKADIPIGYEFPRRHTSLEQTDRSCQLRLRKRVPSGIVQRAVCPKPVPRQDRQRKLADLPESPLEIDLRFDVAFMLIEPIDFIVQ